jgi:hypothetical protein
LLPSLNLFVSGFTPSLPQPLTPDTLPFVLAKRLCSKLKLETANGTLPALRQAISRTVSTKPVHAYIVATEAMRENCDNFAYMRGQGDTLLGQMSFVKFNRNGMDFHGIVLDPVCFTDVVDDVVVRSVGYRVYCLESQSKHGLWLKPAEIVETLVAKPAKLFGTSTYWQPPEDLEVNPERGKVFATAPVLIKFLRDASLPTKSHEQNKATVLAHLVLQCTAYVKAALDVQTVPAAATNAVEVAGLLLS